MRTKVGYTGGSLDAPTYRRLGDHSEAVQVVFDPAVISYADLLGVFWRSHDPAARPWSRQYTSAIFYADENQRRAAEVSRDRFEAVIGRPILTEIRPLDRFFAAEDYHQKYRLRAQRSLYGDLAAHYSDDEALVDSTAAARVNGFLDGGDSAELELEIDSLGLSPIGCEELRGRVRARNGR